MRLTILCAGATILLPALALSQEQRPQGKFDPAAMLKKLDRNGDGFVDKDEAPERLQQRFERLDRNNDGKLNAEELRAAFQRLGGPPPQAPGGADDALFRLLDANNDGKLSREELQNAVKIIDKLDRNKDGMLEPRELGPAGKQKGGRPGEINTPPAKGERIADKLKVGDAAPDFNLPLVQGAGQIRLSDLYAKKPVVLIFASYT